MLPVIVMGYVLARMATGSTSARTWAGMEINVTKVSTILQIQKAD